MKKTLTITVSAIAFLLLLIYGYNHLSFQSAINDLLEEDYRNEGVDVSVHLSGYLNPDVLVYDLQDIKGEKSKADVFRLFLQFAEKMKDKSFEYVELSFRGNTKFKIRGNYFSTLGKEYSSQNPLYTMRTFTEHVLRVSGENAYSQWTGGFLGVMGKQMEDFDDFNNKWYLNQLVN